MQCERRWPSGGEGSRDESSLRTDGGSGCGEDAWRRIGKDRTCLISTRSNDENRKAKLTARPAGTGGVDKKGTRRPADQDRSRTLRKKHTTDVPVRDRVRPGREAPGRLWRPAALGRTGQGDSLAAPNGEASAHVDPSGRDPPKPSVQCCPETKWTCWSCGTVWHKELAKHE